MLRGQRVGMMYACHRAQVSVYEYDYCSLCLSTRLLHYQGYL